MHLGVFISAAICVNSSMDSDILQLRGLASSSSPSFIIIMIIILDFTSSLDFRCSLDFAILFDSTLACALGSFLPHT